MPDLLVPAMFYLMLLLIITALIAEFRNAGGSARSDTAHGLLTDAETAVADAGPDDTPRV
jgi:hypothetical protein